MKRHLAVLASLLGVLATSVAACSGERSGSGLGEPIRVRNGAFKLGALPGPLGPGPGVTVTAIESASTVLRPGQGEKTLGGRASIGTVAVAVGLAELAAPRSSGSGYWVFPAEGPDPLNNNELGWQALVEIGRDVSPGKKELRVVAIDAAGNAGPQRAFPVCVPGLVPDNLNACDPTIPPPAAVVTLTWDTPVDLDIVVVAPDGRVIDAKHPRGAEVDGVPPAPFVDRDSNAACSLDLLQQENVIFPDVPAAGSYLVFANLFEACDRAPVHFKLTVSSRQRGPDGNLQLVETETRRGSLLGFDVNGGARLGTYVSEVAF